MEEFTALTNDRGLYKKILREGSGPVAPKNSVIKVVWKGILETGEMFHESEIGGATLDLTNDNFLNGLAVGITTMKKGEKAILVMRSDYAYGEEGFDNVPADASLIYCIDLLEFKVSGPKKR